MLIDAHAHIDEFDDTELPSVLDALARREILTFAMAMDPASFLRTEEIAARSEWVIPAFGIHPWRAPDHVDDLTALDPFVARAPMLGEIGLDFHFVEDESTYPAQRTVYEYFVSAARDQGKILNLHTKGAEREILDTLDDQVGRHTIIHWYSGPGDLLGDFFDLGVSFTVGVEVLHSELIGEIARAIPLEHLLVETDCPGGEQFLTGNRGGPDGVVDVIEGVAAIRGSTPDRITESVRDNVARLISGDPRLRTWQDLVAGAAHEADTGR